MSDVILESIRSSIMVLILIYLAWVGAREQLQHQPGWWFIVAGFALVFLGSAVDITDNYDSLNKYVFIGDTAYEAFLEKVVGNLIGSILLLIGLWYWLPMIAALRRAEHDLSSYSRGLEARVEERTSDLKEANRRLEAEVVERRHAEETTVRLKRQNELILNSAGEGIYGLDRDGNLTFVNPAAAKMLGCEVDELIGQSQHAVLHGSGLDGATNPQEENPDQAAVPVLSAPDDGEAHRVDDFFWRKDGTSFPVEYISTPIRDEAGDLSGAVVTFNDITERRVVERMKDEFISVVSHELRTPLTSIRGSLGLLAAGRLGGLPEEGQHMLDIAVSNTDRLVRLINDILDIERMESGKVTMEMMGCDAADLMTQATDVMQKMADEAGVTLSATARSARLHADPDRILQTLTNVLSNAIKFSPRGGTVLIAAERQGEEIRFQVEDQGRGIPADMLESIFDRFQQVDASDSREKGGTGLGLAICRSIVQQHGGEIWAESPEGQGSTFIFTLPQAQPSRRNNRTARR